MQKLLTWIKQNKLSATLMAVLVFILVVASTPTPQEITNLSSKDASMEYYSSMPSVGGAPRMDIAERMVSTNSDLSLVVKSVKDTIADITDYAKNNGGYMVSASSTAPEGLSNGNITIRVPADSLDATLDFLRNQALKVVSESIYGSDITDQYMDVEERLSILNETKARYEAILDQATDVDEILNVTNQILYIQDQIDSLTGQLEYLAASANTSLVTVYLSTDEFELPYAPDQPWRPEVVFKYAVRSVVQTLRDGADLAIWLGVYSIFWLPALVIFFLIKKKGTTPKKK